MQLLTPIEAAFAVVIAIIVLGILTEKRTVKEGAVIRNVAAFSVILGSVSLSYTMLFGLLIYLCVGFLTIHFRARSLYILLGFKTFGALHLTILLAQERLFWLTLDITKEAAILDFLLIWCIVALAVHIVGYAYTHKRKLVS